jgi:hypothetical protein
MGSTLEGLLEDMVFQKGYGGVNRPERGKIEKGGELMVGRG